MKNNQGISKDQLIFVGSVIKRRRRVKFTQLIIGLFLIGFWEIAAQFKLIDAFIFSSPSRIFKCFIEMVLNGKIFYHTGVTLVETIVSFGIGTALGSVIAMGLWWSDYMNKVLEPYLVVFNSLPKTALAPVIIVWLGNNYQSIIFTALMISLVVTILNLLNGFLEVDKEKIKLIKTFGGGKKEMFTKVVFPGNIPTLISTMKINIGLSLIGVIIGEFLVAKAGLGYLIVYGSQVFKMDWVMLSVIILALIATVLYRLILFYEKRCRE